MKQDAISFRNWKQELGKEPFDSRRRADWEFEIIEFLRHCKTLHAPATVELAKQYLLAREARSSGPAREALRWFFVKGRENNGNDQVCVDAARQAGLNPRPSPTPPLAVERMPRRSTRLMHPPPASSDLGVNTWEAALIQEIRVRGFLWRTEQTYREWAVRFARFVAPRSPHAATGDDVSRFLTALAVNGRASPSAQKQALNAVVFFMQEALHRDLGEMEFAKARARERVPTVLSKDEVARLLAKLSDGSRLMGEVMYGSGLRLMELLRLRVQHLDSERGQIKVHGGKGDRVEGFASRGVLA